MIFLSVLLSILSASVLASEFGFTVEISSGKYECYFVPVTSEKHKHMEVDYQVIDGGNLDINFMLILGADILSQGELFLLKIWMPLFLLDTMKTEGSHK